jgi:hypothetical protein
VFFENFIALAFQAGFRRFLFSRRVRKNAMIIAVCLGGFLFAAGTPAAPAGQGIKPVDLSGIAMLRCGLPPGIERWDEFSPALYDAEIAITARECHR